MLARRVGGGFAGVYLILDLNLVLGVCSGCGCVYGCIQRAAG